MKFKLSYSTDFLSEIRQETKNTKFILGSGSPRRSEILTMLKLDFRQIIPDLDENISHNGIPADYALKLARLKAQSFDIDTNEIIITADTIVVLNDQILGKPKDGSDASRMLERLSDKTHTVITAVSVKSANSQKPFSDFCQSFVKFKKLDSSQIEDYIYSEEPFGKAGAYAIQGLGGVLVESFEGELDNIIGFPAKTFLNVFRRLKNEV